MRLIDADKLRTIRSIQSGDFNSIETIQKWIDDAPTVDAEPVEFEWCHDCKEYDQNAHCCHRWTKVIRNTVNDLKTQGYESVRHGRWVDGHCSNCGCDVPAYIIDWKWQKDMDAKFCPQCGAKMDGERRDEDETD